MSPREPVVLVGMYIAKVIAPGWEGPCCSCPIARADAWANSQPAEPSRLGKCLTAVRAGYIQRPADLFISWAREMMYDRKKPVSCSKCTSTSTYLGVLEHVCVRGKRQRKGARLGPGLVVTVVFSSVIAFPLGRSSVASPDQHWHRGRPRALVLHKPTSWGRKSINDACRQTS